MELKPGYKQTEVGVIPEVWEVSQLDGVAEVKTGPFGSALHERDYVPDGTPIITVEHLGESGVMHIGLPMVSDADRTRLQAYALKAGDIVFSRVGAIDRNALIRQEEDGWLFSGRLLRVRPDERMVFAQYLSYQFHGEAFRRRVRAVAVGQTMASLNTRILEGILVVRPQLPEQRAIAQALSDVDALIVALENLIAKKRGLKQAAMQQLLTGRTRLPEFSIEWTNRRLGLLADIVSGGTPSTAESGYWDGDIRWCIPTDITSTPGKYLTTTERTITRAGLDASSARLLPAGTLLLCTRATIGEVKIATVEMCTNQGFKSLIVREGTSNEFLYYLMLTVKPQLERMAVGSTFGEVSKKDIASMELCLPEYDEQVAISEVLADMDAETEALEKRLAKTRDLKQGMMQELLTGRTRLV